MSRGIRVWALVLILVTLAGLAGCGEKASVQTEQETESKSVTTEQKEKSDDTSTKEQTVNKDVTISVSAAAGWIRDIDRELAKKFEEETGIKVDIQANPNEQYGNVLMTRLQAGEGPDIFMAESGLALQKHMPDKYAVDLSNEAWVEKYPDFMIDHVTFKDKIVGFSTWGRDFRAMIYNSELFEKYNIQVPTSYATFKEACETLLENGITPVYFAGGADWYCGQAFDGATNIESKAKGTYDKLNNQETTFAESEEALKFLRNLKDSADSGYFGENFLANTYDQGASEMSSGKYAMWFGWATFVNDIAAVGGPSADNYLAFPSPYADDFGTLAMTGAGMTRLINKESKYIDECKAYFDFLAREDNLQAFYDGRMDLLETTLKGAKAHAPKNFESALNMVEGNTLPTPNQAINYFTADGSFWKNMQSMLYGSMTPEQVLESLDAAREKMFDTVGQ